MVSNVAAILKALEKVAHKGMIYRSSGEIALEVRLGDVSHLIRAIDEDVIPRLGAARLGLIRLIPRIVRLASVIEVDDDAPVTISLMVHQLSRRELRLRTPRTKRLPNTDHNPKEDPNQE